MLNRIAEGILLTLVAVAGIAQSNPSLTRVYGPGDRDIPTPLHFSKAVSDSSALQLFIGFVKASGVEGWKGMTAQGAITFPGDAQSYPAHLYLRDSGCSRLDVDKPGDSESTIFRGNIGSIKTSGRHSTLVSSDLTRLGLVSFPRLLSNDYPTGNSVLTDRGILTIAGMSLHRISLDDPATDATGNPWKTVDLYFDPASGFLVQSVSFIHLYPADASFYMVETSYEDYRTENSITLPHRIIRRLNGNIEWTLQLDQLDLSKTPDLSFFSF